jgi:predicted transcriptional regulator
MRRKANGRLVQRCELRKIGRRQVMPGFPVPAHAFSEEQVRDYYSGDRIVCLQCGKKYLRLANHLESIHGLQLDTYREMYGLPYRGGLLCEESKARYRKCAEDKFESGAWNLAHWRATQPKAADASRGRKRRIAPFQLEKYTKRMLRLAGRESPYEASDYQAILAEIERGNRTLDDILEDEGRPCATTFYRHCRENPDYDRKVKDAFEAQPFWLQSVQSRLGARFKQAVWELFLHGLSDQKIARALGVTAMTSNKYTKKWRHEKESR